MQRARHRVQQCAKARPCEPDWPANLRRGVCEITVRVRVATPNDESALEVLIERSTRTLLIPFLSPEQIEASLEVMTLERRLVEDGTYFVAEDEGVLVASGGWGRRREYAMAHAGAQNAHGLLDPGRDPALVRAMYTSPEHARRGLGSRILAHCESAARRAGFTRAELLATLAGEPLYLANGWHEIERTTVPTPSGGLCCKYRPEW